MSDEEGATAGRGRRAPTMAERCRTIAARARTATLCTIAQEPAGYPYGSLVAVAVDGRGRPLLLLSRLAEHTRNLQERPQASVLLTEVAPPRSPPTQVELGSPTQVAPSTQVELGSPTQVAPSPTEVELGRPAPGLTTSSPTDVEDSASRAPSTEVGWSSTQALALGRLTLLGRCHAIEDEERGEARRTFLAHHPDAATYADFPDFAFYRLEPIALRYIGGFGRMSWLDPAEYASAEPDPLADSAPSIVAHMNDDHADAVLAYARAAAGVPEATSATMTGVDRYGFDLAITTAAGTETARVAFDAPVGTAMDVRRALVELAKRARRERAG